MTKRPRALEEDTRGISEQPPDMNHGHDSPESDPTFEGKAIPTPQPNEAYVRCPDGCRTLGISGWVDTRPRREDPTAVRRTNESSVRLEVLLWKQQPGGERRNVVNAREKLRDTFDGLFWNKATNDGALHVALDDIMAQPEMRPFLVCDLLEEINSGSRYFYRVRETGGYRRIEAKHGRRHRIPSLLYAAILGGQVKDTLHGCMASWKRQSQQEGQAARLYRETDSPPVGDVKYRVYVDTEILCFGAVSITTNEAGHLLVELDDDWLSDDPIVWIRRESDGATCHRTETRSGRCWQVDPCSTA